jgi:hypothetical protein
MSRNTIENIKPAYWRRKEVNKLRAQHTAARKKARKQREKEAADGATADGSCVQRLADPNAKKMSKIQCKAEIGDSAVTDDNCPEEEVGLDVDAAAVPPIKESWEPTEFNILVHYGPPIDEACRPELAFVASARGDVDAASPFSDGEGVAADRPAKSQVEARKKNMQFDKKHKKPKEDLGTPEGEIDLVSPNLTLASKAVRGELRIIKRDIVSTNYQNSLTLAFNMAAQNNAQQQSIVADAEEYRLHMKEPFLAQRARQSCAPASPAADIGDPSMSVHGESAGNDKASEEAITDNVIISSSDNESEEEGGGNGVVED